MGIERFPDFIPETPKPEFFKPPEENIFLERARAQNPEYVELKSRLAQLIQRIGALKSQMAKGIYHGKLTDLAALEQERDALLATIAQHPDKPGAYGRLSGSREETVFRKTN